MLRKKQSRKDDISADDLWADGDYPEAEDHQTQKWELWLITEKLAPHFGDYPFKFSKESSTREIRVNNSDPVVWVIRC